MKGKKYDYFHATIRKAEQIMEFHTLEDFAGYAQANHIRQVILTKDFETGEPSFALTSKGALYICPSKGYKTIEDFQSAAENHFPDAVSYYRAMEMNCTTYTDYQTAVDHKIEGEQFEEMKKSGYVDGFKLMHELREQNSSLPRLESITHVKELFDFAKGKGFKDFAHFMNVWQAGFTDPLEYDLAIEKGLDNSKDYEIFKKGSFTSVEEYKTAKPLEITSVEELNRYLDLNISAFPGSSFDELLLISIISKLENGSRTEFRKLYEHFLKEENGYKRISGSGELKLPKWYTKRLRKEVDVKDFLLNSDKVKLLGTFDADKGIFETIHIKRRKVVVDGSNVAYNSDMVDRKKGVYGAEFKNILVLIKKLKGDYGFEDIHVISDSNLIHKVKDKELLREIKALCKYSESPAGVPADLYLINQVKKQHCLLITNDAFKDWKLADKWIEHNIDFYRLKFVINGDIVLLPYMERFERPAK